jgi:tRNA threonylcarbamoyl adenosine modification protein (Sua5/YciO/YrdC/YwlC family)
VITILINPKLPENELLDRAARAITDGQVVAIPTDTFYGLAVDPRNEAAVARLYRLKGRSTTSALTLIAADAEQAMRAATFNQPARRLAERWWPGPLTIVAEALPVIPSTTLAGGRTAGVRVPDHVVARGIARAFGFCITATSANQSGQPPLTAASEVRRSLPDVDLLVDAGDTPGGAPSTIVDATARELRLVRAGAIPWELVLEFLK